MKDGKAVPYWVALEWSSVFAEFARRSGSSLLCSESPVRTLQNSRWPLPMYVHIPWWKSRASRPAAAVLTFGRR